MKPRTRIAPYVWILTMLVISCNLSTLPPASPPEPTTIVGIADTLTVMTAEAASTQTALPISPTAAPSWTPLPTYTPSLMPTLGTSAPESPGVTPTFGGSLPGELSCKLLSQSVKNGRHFGPKETFEVGWKVRNNGTAAWDPSTTDFTYIAGARMYAYTPAQLPESVAHGAEIALGASMIAPKSSGTHTTVWSLRRGNEYFCRVRLTIIVP